MAQSPTTIKLLKMGDAATYKICVQGHLDPVWADRLGNMVISTIIKDGTATESQLIGRLKDQAELVGVLNGLYELRTPIIYLELLESV